MLQNVRPLLPKDEAVDLPAELRSFTKAEKLWQDDTRAVRVGSRDRSHFFSHAIFSFPAGA